MSEAVGHCPAGPGLSPPVEPVCAVSPPDGASIPNAGPLDRAVLSLQPKQVEDMNRAGGLAALLNEMVATGAFSAEQRNIAFRHLAPAFAPLIEALNASAIEAGTGETGTGSIRGADESAVPKADAQPGAHP